jgi:hypothetical protein
VVTNLSHIAKLLLGLVTGLAASLIVGCSDPVVNSTNDRLEYRSLERARKGMQRSEVVCQDKSECPGFTASVVFVEQQYQDGKSRFFTGFCTGQLIAGNRILTNWHCLPANIRQEGAACSEWLTVKFPRTLTHDSEVVACQKVIALEGTPVTTFSQDWAIIELERDVDRPKAELDFSGIPDRTELKAFPNEYHFLTDLKVKGGPLDFGVGVIKKRVCTTDMGSLFAAYYNSETSLMFAAKCVGEIIKGMSGTAVLSADDKVLGLISAAGSGEKKTEFLHAQQVISRRVTMGTNLYCIPELNPDGEQEACSFVPYMSRTPLMKYARIFFAAHRSVVESQTLLPALQQRNLEPENMRLALTEESEAGRQFLDFAILNKDLQVLLSPGSESVYRRRMLEIVQLERHPYFPSCVEPGALPEFTTHLPFLLRDGAVQDTFSMNEFGEISFEQEPRWESIEIQVKFQADGTYKVTMPSLDADLVELYLAILDLQREQRHPCRESSLVVDSCAIADQLEEQLNTIQAQSLYSQRVWDTQIWLSAYDQAPEISLSVCED